MTLTWPASHGQILLWANVVLVWMAANYLLPPETARGEGRQRVLAALRAVLAAGAVLILSGWRGRTVALSVALLALLLPLARSAVARKRRRAEWEIGCNAAALLASAALIRHAGLEYLWAPWVDLPGDRLAALTLVAAGTLFLLRGAAEVVRGILEKAESLPTQLLIDGGAIAGAQEFNRGRLIGYLERLLIMAIVMAGQFGALGILIAAKGLIRSRELDRHEFAEYFLIGTLASITVAFFVGLGLRALVLALW